MLDRVSFISTNRLSRVPYAIYELAERLARSVAKPGSVLKC
jgi:hypothetical protein